MKKKILTKSAAAVLSSAIIAGNALALGTDGSIFATLNNNNIITESVLAAEVAAVPQWSTALVYAGFNPDLASGSVFQNVSSVGASWYILNKPGWKFRVDNSIATTGEVLNYQYMKPGGILTKAGPIERGYLYNDDNGTTRFQVKDFTGYLGTKNLWDFTKEEFIKFATDDFTQNVGTLYYDAVDEGTYYRITYNMTSFNSKNEIIYGYETAIQVKATGKFYVAKCCQTQPIYNDIITKTMVYSFMPTVLQ